MKFSTLILFGISFLMEAEEVSMSIYLILIPPIRFDPVVSKGEGVLGREAKTSYINDKFSSKTFLAVKTDIIFNFFHKKNYCKI